MNVILRVEDIDADLLGAIQRKVGNVHHIDTRVGEPTRLHIEVPKADLVGKVHVVDEMGALDTRIRVMEVRAHGPLTPAHAREVVLIVQGTRVLSDESIEALADPSVTPIYAVD